MDLSLKKVLGHIMVGIPKFGERIYQGNPKRNFTLFSIIITAVVTEKLSPSRGRKVTNHTQIENHTLLHTIILHVLPGILTGSFYFLVRPLALKMGYPSIFALVLAGALILIPIELGYLLYQGKKKTGRYTLDGIVSYRKAIPWWQTLIWVAIVFVATGIIFTLMKPVDSTLQEKIFPWLPGLDFGLNGGYSKATLMLTYALFFVFMAVIAPVVEELYFRGYLLPRMSGRFAPVLHSFLFAIYHTFTPWMFLTRTIGLLPLIYTVQRKNIYIGIIVHILVNTLDVVTGIVFISKMT